MSEEKREKREEIRFAGLTMSVVGTTSTTITTTTTATSTCTTTTPAPDSTTFTSTFGWVELEREYKEKKSRVGTFPLGIVTSSSSSRFINCLARFSTTRIVLCATSGRAASGFLVWTIIIILRGNNRWGRISLRSWNW